MRLLLVEDDVLVASGIKLGLSNAGYALDWVGTAERALEASQRDAFDIAVIDIGLPAMDGLSLTQALRAQGQTMPVLILTARDALQRAVEQRLLGEDPAGDAGDRRRTNGAERPGLRRMTLQAGFILSQ